MFREPFGNVKKITQNISLSRNQWGLHLLQEEWKQELMAATESFRVWPGERRRRGGVIPYISCFFLTIHIQLLIYMCTIKRRIRGLASLMCQTQLKHVCQYGGFFWWGITGQYLGHDSRTHPRDVDLKKEALLRPMTAFERHPKHDWPKYSFPFVSPY